MGNLSKSPNKDIKTEELQHKSGTLALSACLQGWRNYMEDFSIIQKINNDILLAGVFDGHGGPEVACYASRNLHLQLKSDPFFGLKNYNRSLVNSFKRLDATISSDQGEAALKAIHKQFGSEVSKKKQTLGQEVGSTANVVLLTNQKIYAANIGDSRSVLCRKGVAIPLSSDHKPDNPGEKDRILKAGGFVTNGRINSGINVSRTLGDFIFKSNKNKNEGEQMVISYPEIKELERDQDDQYILIGTDGVWEKYGQNHQQLIDEFNQHLQQHRNRKDGVKEFLVRLVPDEQVPGGPGQDNMSIVVVFLNASCLMSKN